MKTIKESIFNDDDIVKDAEDALVAKVKPLGVSPDITYDNKNNTFSMVDGMTSDKFWSKEYNTYDWDYVCFAYIHGKNNNDIEICPNINKIGMLKCSYRNIDSVYNKIAPNTNLIREFIYFGSPKDKSFISTLYKALKKCKIEEFRFDNSDTDANSIERLKPILLHISKYVKHIICNIYNNKYKLMDDDFLNEIMKNLDKFTITDKAEITGSPGKLNIKRL